MTSPSACRSKQKAQTWRVVGTGQPPAEWSREDWWFYSITVCLATLQFLLQHVWLLFNLILTLQCILIRRKLLDLIKYNVVSLVHGTFKWKAIFFFLTEGTLQIPLNDRFLAGATNANLKSEEVLVSFYSCHQKGTRLRNVSCPLSSVWF